MELDERRVEYGNAVARILKNYFMRPGPVRAAGTRTWIDQLRQMSYKASLETKASRERTIPVSGRSFV